VTKHELADGAEFLDDSSFRLAASPSADIPLGLYELPRRSGEAHLYRLSHPLAELIIGAARTRELAPAHITFDYGDHKGRISALEPFVGANGVLCAIAVSIEALDQFEDVLVLAGETDSGSVPDEAVLRRLLSLPAAISNTVLSMTLERVHAHLTQRQSEIERTVADRNILFFEAEAEKLDGWAEDLKIGLEREIKDLDRQIREAKRAASAAPILEAKLAGQKQVKSLEAQRTQRRKSLFESQDAIDERREELIAAMEGKLEQSVVVQQLFSVRWSLR
jgi:hypothetical protein